jgi:hypothetical protein
MSEEITKLEQHLLMRDAPKHPAYYNGKMSYALHGKQWDEYVAETFPDLKNMDTSENVFKAVIDLYAENLVPVPEELRGFSNVLVSLLSRGECPVVVDSAGTPHFPETYEMISDGKFSVAAIYTRSIETMEDFVTFAYSSGKTRLFSKSVPDDLSSATHEGYSFVEETGGNEFFRFALDDKGFGGIMMAIQDRVNHSIIDQTVVAEMYARPFWYLLNFEQAPVNPYMPTQPANSKALQEQRADGGSGRVFTTSSEGPFGQLEPPTIADMISYHDSIIDKVSQATGIPQHYFKPGQGTPPTGIALKVLTKRFNNKVARMREDLTPELERLAALLGVAKTGTEKTEDGKEEQVYELWNTSDDLLQDALDQHGINLSQMGYPLEYIAEVVTPGVDLEDYMDDTDGEAVDKAVPGQPTDMTAAGQTGLPATPGQVAKYASNPGQRQKVKA